MKITIEFEGKPFRPYGPAFKAVRVIKTIDIQGRPGEHVSLSNADVKTLLDKLGGNLEWVNGKVQLIEPEKE